MQQLRNADPAADPAVISQRARDMIMSGKDVPEILNTTAPLYKIVPKDQKMTKYSLYFFDQNELNKIKSMDIGGIADYLALPNQSIDSSYDIYKIIPKNRAGTKVFRSEIAPASQGSINKAGGATQILVPDRSLWSDPIPEGSM